MKENKYIHEFFQFLQDAPFDKAVKAVSAGGKNIALDVDAAESMMSAFIKDFFGNETPSTAVATTAVVAGAPVPPGLTPSDNASGAIGG